MTAMKSTSHHKQPEIAIREARPSDVEAVHEALVSLSRLLGATHKLTSTPQDLRTHGFGSKPAFEVLVAEASGAFAGMCIFFPSFSTWMGAPGVYVQDLFVDEKFRGRGVGERLLRRVASLTRDRGGVYLRLSVDTGNAKAQAFYERLGISWSRLEQVHAATGEKFLQLTGRQGEAV